jgi:hypothetical protein
MNKPRFGTFLAQGAAGNAIVIYLSLIAVVFYYPNGYNFFLMFLLPIYLIGMGIVGAVIGAVVWLAGRLHKRRLGVIARDGIGIVFPALLVAILTFRQGSIVDRQQLMIVIGSGWLVALPAALIAGSRFSPLRRIVFGSSRESARRDFGSGFSFPAALLLRFGSVFGLMESLLYLACLASSVRVGWGITYDGETFVATGLAVVYFAVSTFVSCASPRKRLLLATSVLINAPLAIWTLDPHRVTDGVKEAAAIIAWIFISLWVLFVGGRMISPDLKDPRRPRRPRILPLTLCEIQIRQALNRW